MTAAVNQIISAVRSKHTGIIKQVFTFNMAETTMSDFTYRPVGDIGTLQRGDHVAWKHTSQSGRVYYHHAIVEDVNKTDGYINVIAKTIKGVGRSVIDNLDGIHLVDIISKPQVQPKSGFLGRLSGLLPVFNNTNQQKTEEGNTTPEAMEVGPESTVKAAASDAESQARQIREAVYEQARSQIGNNKKYNAQNDNCETFAYLCRTGQEQEKHDCPMCTTTAQKDKFIFT